MDRRLALLAFCGLALSACDRADPYECDPTPAWRDSRLETSGTVKIGDETADALFAMRDRLSLTKGRRADVTFNPPRNVGVHRLEDVGAVALVCPQGSGLEYAAGDTCLDHRGNVTTAEHVSLSGTLEILDVRVDVASGMPTGEPYERPWGWAMKTTNVDVLVDVRAVSRPTWDANGYCD